MIKSWILILSQLPFLIIIIMATWWIIVWDYFSKIYSETQLTSTFIYMLLGYMFCWVFFTASLFKEYLIYATIFLEVMYLIWMLLMWYFIFGETLSKVQLVGAGFAIVWIFILIFAE